MTRQFFTNIPRRIGLFAAVALSLSVTAPRSASIDAKTTMAIPILERCQMMRLQDLRLFTEMKSEDSAITLQTAAMNAAPAEKRVELLAILVTRLVDQRSSRDAQRGRMNEDMAMHLMEHLQMGADSLAECIVLKSMQGRNEKPTINHGQKKPTSK